MIVLFGGLFEPHHYVIILSGYYLINIMNKDNTLEIYFLKALCQTAWVIYSIFASLNMLYYR